MSAFDVVVLQYLTAYGLPMLTILGLILLVVKYFDSVRNRLLSRIVSSFDATYERIMNDHKKILFSPLHNVVSSDWKLRNRGLIRILEIGFRTGENLKYYPKNCHLVVADRNTYIQSYLNSNSELTSNVNIEYVLVSTGENLNVISDNSVDAVVGTFILCSAPRVAQVLREIKRILAPGGLYFFLEHCPEPEDTFVHKMQNILTVTKLWPTFFDGCHLNRNIEEDMKCIHFSELDYQYVRINNEQNKFSKLMTTHLIGTAVK